MVKLECPKCGYSWDYQGKMSKKATCPDCHYSVPIGESRVKEEEGGANP